MCINSEMIYLTFRVGIPAIIAIIGSLKFSIVYIFNTTTLSLIIMNILDIRMSTPWSAIHTIVEYLYT